MSDSLASVRKALRSARAAERRVLKYKMNPYNTLSNKSKSTVDNYDVDSAKTTNDVIAETLAIFNRETPSRRSQRKDLLLDASVVQPEVRAAWHEKIGLHAQLDADARSALVKQASVQVTTPAPYIESSEARERRLLAIARWMIHQYHDAEGYDPAKHPAR